MKSKKFKKLLICALIACSVAAEVALGINFYVSQSTKSQIITEIEGEYDCILVLGAGVKNDAPSPMLKDRLEEAIRLYEKGVAPKIIMSGDHGREEYDEVNVMKKYAVERGVPSEDVFMDHAGFSTYESVYRAKDIFQVKKMVIVTQKYHLYRALYISNALGVEAVGSPSDSRVYAGQTYRETREIIARDKDFFYCVLKPKPTYLGDAIPVGGNGDVTND